MENYKRFEDESEEELIYRICNEKEKIGTWDDIAELLNNILKYDYGESTYRKKFQAFKKMLEANQSKFVDGNTQLEEIRLAQEILRKERYKLQAEKLEQSRWFREDARDELFEEKVIESIKKNINSSPNPKPIELIQGTRSAILNIADAHFGKDFVIYGLFDEEINRYNPEIFYERMDNLMGELLQYIKLQNLNKLYVFNLGDSVEGFIRNSQLWSLRYGVVDSSTIFGGYLGKWLKELSNHVIVEYSQTDGNHDELRLLDGKKGEHLNESAGKIVKNSIMLINEENKNFTYVENKTGLIFRNISGYNVMGIHGQVSNLNTAIKDYSDIYDLKIDYLCAGHKHHSEFTNCGVRRGTIGVGSIVGSDDFSMKIRKSADATVSLVILEEGKGKTDEHTFVLN